jgi:hypothetical protein
MHGGTQGGVAGMASPIGPLKHLKITGEDYGFGVLIRM